MNPEPVTDLLNGLICLGDLPPFAWGAGLVAFGALGETRYQYKITNGMTPAKQK